MPLSSKYDFAGAKRGQRSRYCTKYLSKINMAWECIKSFAGVGTYGFSSRRTFDVISRALADDIEGGTNDEDAGNFFAAEEVL